MYLFGAQSDVLAASILSVAGVLLTPLLNWLLIYRAGLGLYGAAYSADFEAGLYLAALSLYVVVRERRMRHSEKKAWPGW